MRKKYPSLVIILSKTWKSEIKTKKILSRLGPHVTISSTNIQRKRGVAMVFDTNKFLASNTIFSSEGWFIHTDLTQASTNKTFSLTGLYTESHETPVRINFYKEYFSKNFNPQPIHLILGDFNMVVDHERDTQNQSEPSHPQLVDLFNEGMAEWDMEECADDITH